MAIAMIVVQILLKFAAKNFLALKRVASTRFNKQQSL